MTISNKAKSIKVQEGLLAALQRKVPAQTIMDDQAPEHSLPRVPVIAPSRNKRRVGKPAQFWFHEEDRRLIRELAAWLSGQGLRLTDSMVIRAALRTAKTGDELLQACRQAAELDGRLRQHKSK